MACTPSRGAAGMAASSRAILVLSQAPSSEAVLATLLGEGKSRFVVRLCSPPLHTTRQVAECNFASYGQDGRRSPVDHPCCRCMVGGTSFLSVGGESFRHPEENGVEGRSPQGVHKEASGCQPVACFWDTSIAVRRPGSVRTSDRPRPCGRAFPSKAPNVVL
jgi:hypothetical protein